MQTTVVPKSRILMCFDDFDGKDIQERMRMAHN